ncbi:MAG: hypothetical protein LBG96_17945 [Tannerella sp.]|jgi:hypothetical protein|nr:hypothetical protein [Tannerella sp.]
MITRRKLIGLGIVLSLFYTILVTAQTGSFRQPPAKFKFHALDHDLVSRENPEPYIDSLIERGVTGLVINVTWDENYMKDEKAWQSLNQLVRLLKSKGLLLWIYDEYGYPSGHAGGLVLAENKDYEALGIVVVKEKSIKNIKNWKKPDDVLEVIYDYHHQNQHYIVCAVRLYEGTAAAANFKRPYINIADKEAVDAFIRITHDAYFQNMENLSGDIDAFFTDEPGLMEGYIDADREYKGGHKYAPVAWAKGLEKEFKKQHGYDLMPKIHSLFEGDDTDARLVRIHYRQTLASLVSDAYFQNITDWCAKHGVKSSGHINNEEYIHEHVAYYGNLFTTLDKSDWIGFDILRGTISRYMSETGEARFMGPKFVGSLARIRGKSTTVMVELCPLEYYLNALHEVTDDQLRAVCNMMWMSGANYLNSYWNINSISDPNGFSNYLGRMGYMLEGTVHDSRIGVYYPVETIQALYKPLHTVQMDNRKLNNEIGRTEKAFQNLTIELWNNQCDYDFLDAQAIENAEVIDGTLRIAGMEFKVVIMSYVQVLPLSVLNKLKTFEQSGGKVVWTGSFPQHGVNSGETAKIAAYAEQIRLSENPASDAAAAADDPMRWESQSPVIVSRFSKDGKPIYMLINNTDKPIEIQGKSLYLDNFELFNPRTGDITQLNKCEFVIDRFSAVFLTGNKFLQKFK